MESYYLNDVVFFLIKIKTLLKIFHWQAPSYSDHKAADFLYNKLEKKIDKFVETFMGDSRIIFNSNRHIINFQNMSKKNVIEMLNEFVDFLSDMEKIARNRPDLLNIRDEILANVEQTLYLLSFGQ